MGSSWLKDSNSLTARVFKDSGGGGVQSLSHIRLLATPRTAEQQASLSFTISQSLLKLMFTESVIPSKHLTLCHVLLLPSTFPSIRVFSNELALPIRQPKYWNFRFSISPSNEYSGLTSFRIDLLAVQGSLKSLLQYHNSKASILWCSTFLMVQLSHLYITTGKKPQLWLHGPLSAKFCLCFLIHCLGLSYLSFQEANIF